MPRDRYDQGMPTEGLFPVYIKYHRESEEDEWIFEKKHQEDLQRLRGFRLLDDDFMTKVFEDIQCAELLLRIILNDEGIHVLEVHSQRGIKNLQGRSVRLDILAIDSHDRVFNVEVQRSDKGAGAKRARYNSALIDANVTEPGDLYEA